MKPKFVYLFVLMVFITACNQPAADKKATPNKIAAKKALNAQGNKKGGKDTLIITTKCAVRVDLDTVQLDKLRKKYGDDAFYTGADDNVYYSYIADSVLKAKDMPVVANKEQKYLKFVRDNGATTLIKIDTLPQPTNYYFFEPSKTPYQPDITDIKAEYQRYFIK
ncbi:MAG: hypothetical protein V4456_03450 [Bacteroidota bacterium]